MRNPIWPFKDCETPDDFMAAVRKAIPHRFKKWKYSCQIYQGELYVTLWYSPYARKRDRWGTYSFNDIACGSWELDEARSPTLRNFPGLAHIKPGGGNFEQCFFRVDLKHLPKIEALVKLRDKLYKLESQLSKKDGYSQGLQREIEHRQGMLRDHEEELKAAHRKKYATDYKKIKGIL